MSFSVEVKEEMCEIEVPQCCILSEVYGICLFASEFSYREIKIITENTAFAKRVEYDFKMVFDMDVTFQKYSENGKLYLKITDKNSIEQMFKALGYDFKAHVSFRINRNIIEDECCKISFMRGVFLSSGIVIDPKKEYHLEISCTSKTLSAGLMSLMLDMDFYPKITVRKGTQVIYFKDSNIIEQFLIKLGTLKSVNIINETKREKDLINNINRKVNCETANLTKIVEASITQRELINKAIALKGISAFPENLHETIHLRLKNEEASLQELSKLVHPPCSKSGISHRMKKITEIASRILEEV